MSTKVLSSNNICDTLFHQHCFPGLLTAHTLSMDDFSHYTNESLFVKPLLSDNLVGSADWVNYGDGDGPSSTSRHTLWNGPFGRLQQQGDAFSSVHDKKPHYTDAVETLSVTTQFWATDCSYSGCNTSSSFARRFVNVQGRRHSKRKNTTMLGSQPKKTASVSKKILQIEKREQEKLRKRFGDGVMEQQQKEESSNSIVKVRICASPSQRTGNNKFNVLKSLLNL